MLNALASTFGLPEDWVLLDPEAPLHPLDDLVSGGGGAAGTGLC